jgi:hypothetical protein
MSDNSELRKLQAIIDDQADRILDLEAALNKAADRIEALEKHKRLQTEDVMNLGAALGQAQVRIEALEVEVERWHRVAMEAGAITCSDGRHIYPRRERIEALEAALNYVADMTYCGTDAEWHFKPGYDPQKVLDAITDHIDWDVLAEKRLDQDSRRHNFEDAGFDTCRHCGERKVHFDHGAPDGK